MVGIPTVAQHLSASQEFPYLQMKLGAGIRFLLNFTMLIFKEDASNA
jgi:hypothetical protein